MVLIVVGRPRGRIRRFAERLRGIRSRSRGRRMAGAIAVVVLLALVPTTYRLAT
jgi:hypothetical protein